MRPAPYSEELTFKEGRHRLNKTNNKELLFDVGEGRGKKEKSTLKRFNQCSIAA